MQFFLLKKIKKKKNKPWAIFFPYFLKNKEGGEV